MGIVLIVHWVKQELIKCQKFSGGEGKLTFDIQINDDVLEVKERLEWVEATMEEAIKGLETLTVIICNSHHQF